MDYIKRMRYLRERRGLTQTQVAEYLGTSQTMYARYERGANELPIRHLLLLCKLYRVSSDYFLGLSNKRRNDAELAQRRISKSTTVQGSSQQTITHMGTERRFISLGNEMKRN